MPASSAWAARVRSTRLRGERLYPAIPHIWVGGSFSLLAFVPAANVARSDEAFLKGRPPPADTGGDGAVPCGRGLARGRVGRGPTQALRAPDRRRAPPDARGGARARPAQGRRRRGGQAAADRVEPAARDGDHTQLHEGGRAAPRPDPGRQPRPDPGGREVRLAARLQALHVCDLVDPAGDHPCPRRPGPDDPAAGPRRRQVRRLLRARRQLAQKLNREPTLAELARETQESEERVRELLELVENPVSLETPVGDGESLYGDLIEDVSSPPPEEQTAEQARAAELARALDQLNPRMRRVLSLRFGLEGGTPKTLEEVGAELGITRERVRQLETRALRELRLAAPGLEHYLRSE